MFYAYEQSSLNYRYCLRTQSYFGEAIILNDEKLEHVVVQASTLNQLIQSFKEMVDDNKHAQAEKVEHDSESLIL